jgi:histidinol dehydrogenase
VQIINWDSLDGAARAHAVARPTQSDAADVAASVREIIAAVRERGDAAVREFTRKFDGAVLESLFVTTEEMNAAAAALPPSATQALEQAIDNVRRFHEAQRVPAIRVEPAPGVVCERIVRPIDAVGLYVPAGTAPLPSTAIMLAVPAAIAGCPTRVLATPPRADGSVDPSVLVAAQRCDVETVIKVGGAQAIAALAYGTETIPKVDKVFGPGNAWVTAAKLAVANDPAGAALDLPAGPSEVLVIADAAANPDFVAADLLAQAEHSADAQALLLTSSSDLAVRVAASIGRQIERRSRQTTLRAALEHLRLIVVRDLETAFAISNAYAPEHLIVQTQDARAWLGEIRAAGSVFLGAFTPETMGDYCSGTNHVLPTYGFARAYSGLGLQDFVRRITVQELTAQGLSVLGPTAVTLAELEGLDAHAEAVNVRLAACAASGISP